MNNSPVIEEITNKASELAGYEVGWWQGHHRKNLPACLDQMSKLYEKLYNMTHDEAVECVKLRIEAGSTHDIAEKYEDEGNESKAQEYWDTTRKLLIKHFELLLYYRRGSKFEN